MSARVTRCRECGGKHPAKALRGATAAQAERSHKLIEGDLLCADCREGLSLDADAIDCATLDAETTGVAA